MNFNSFWYFLLLIYSVIIFMFTILKKRNIQTLLLIFAIIGFGYFIETIIFNFLGSYDYYPHIIKSPSFYDNNLGAFFSNALALPVTATFIVTLHLHWVWMILFSLFFVGVEWLFLKLHIYSHNWWTLVHTGGGIFVYFAIAKLLYQQILRRKNVFFHYLILYFIVGSISGSAHILPIIFFSNRVYHPGWFADPGRDSMALAAVFYLCASFYYCLLTVLAWKIERAKYVLTGILMYIVNLILISAGFLQSLVWWDIPYYVVLSLVLLKISIVVEKRLAGTNDPANQENYF
ncbi:hypothetical protein HYI36_25470 [Bacillus sp. Gen3]|nr:hypothetical protein [Bacillus sp. Gen3]